EMAPCPLSFAQQRLWFLHQLQPDSPAYTIPLAVRLVGSLNVHSLEKSLSEIIRRHTILRTTFHEHDQFPVQMIAAPTPFSLPHADISTLAPMLRQAEAQCIVQQEANQPFDLTSGPLLRALLLRLGEDEHVLLLTMHHIISDAWSSGVLVREITTLYRA